jgi:arylsulfatase A-like enzyme
MSEGGIRTCFIARWPEVIPAGASTDEFISALDIFPTLAALSGAELPSYLRLDGQNIMPVLEGREKSSRREMFWHSRHSRAARIDNYKWVESPTHHGLFDLQADVGESRDLSGERPEVMAQLKSRWQAWRSGMDQAEPRGPFRDY